MCFSRKDTHGLELIWTTNKITTKDKTVAYLHLIAIQNLLIITKYSLTILQ